MLHNRMLDPQTPVKDRRFLICQPTSGLGNQLNAVVTCFIFALLMKRAMLLDSEATLRFNLQRSEDEQPHYPMGMEGILQNAPFDWDIQRVLRPPERGGLGMTINSSEVLELYHYAEEQLCGNITDVASQHTFTSLTLWSWLPGIVSNPIWRPRLLEYFGEDRHGVPPVFAHVGPLLYQPIRPIARAVQTLRHLRVSDFSIGIQIRAGGRLRVPKKKDAPMFVKCAFASTPAEQRGKPITLFLVVDTPALRKVILKELVSSEGKVVGGTSNAVHYADPMDVDMRRFFSLEQIVELLPFEVVVVDFASGSRLIFLGRQVDTKSKDGMRMAILEIWGLGALADLLVVTENSSFADLSHAMFPKPTFTVTASGRCYALMSTEPLGAGYQYKAASCFSPRMQQYTWLWQH